MKSEAPTQTNRTGQPGEELSVTHTGPAGVAWRLSPGLRKALLVLHIVTAVSWMGVDIALFILLMTARTTDDPALVVSGFQAIRMIVPAAVPPLSLGILVTGILLGLGTRWGLLRHWWVLVKLLLSLVMTFLVFFSLVPAVNSMAVGLPGDMSADAMRASLGALPTMLLFPPVVSFLMLGTAAILSVFKPWQRTPWSRERDTGRSAG
jgi:uncharacterized membrane protein